MIRVDVNCEIRVALREDTGLMIESAVNGREAVELFTAHPQCYDIMAHMLSAYL